MQKPLNGTKASEVSGDVRQTAAGQVVRDMTRNDLEAVGGVLFRAFNDASSRHGYAPRMADAKEGTAWAWAILRHGPHELVVADVDGRAAGICCLHPRGEQGGIGPVAVDPALQGRGVGRMMMEEVIRRSRGLQSVRLFQEAFNPASFSLYYANDFLPVADMLDLTAGPRGQQQTPPCEHVQELSAQELEEAVAYDRPRSKYDRRTDFAYYLQWGKVFVHRQGGRIGGLLACLPGARSVQCGPLIAEGEEEAGRLFERAVSVFHDRQCQTRVMARDRSLVRSLQALGFRVYCLNMLMVRGAWRPGECIEAFGRFPEGT